MINNNRTIENAWNMLQYLYDELRTKRFKDMDIMGIETLDDLYGAIIAKWCASLAKEGLYKEYVAIENEEMTSPRGQINFQETISKQSRLRGTLICSYDELSENIYINHILKGTLQYLLFDNNIDKLVKTEIKKAMQLFNGVDYIDINFVQWKNVKFNNSNMRYKHLIEICKTLILEHKMVKAGELDDNKRLYLLFKKQIIKWYKLKYSDTDKVEIFEQQYTLDREAIFETKLYKTQRLVSIRNDKQAVLICVRLQDELLLEDNTLTRQHLNELIKYLREYKKAYSTKVAGCLVYINTDKRKLNLQPITVNAVNDYMIGETTIDIHDQWRFIANKLEDTYKYFIARERNKGKH